MINKERIKKQLLKQLKDKGILKEIKIYRNELDDFNEATGEKIEVCTVSGYLYKGRNNVINLKVEDSANITTNHNEKLLVIHDDKSPLIKEDDFFITEDRINYKITDKGNNFDVVFDMTVERF